MKRAVSRLSEKVYDLAIVGGGIYGAWMVWDAALRGHKSLENRMTVGVATLRLDGFVSRSAGETPATLTTRPFELEGGSLEVNVDASRGQVCVELLDTAGRPIPGFTRADCEVASQVDELRLEPRWKKHENVAPLIGRIVRVKFYLENAHLYAFQVNP